MLVLYIIYVLHIRGCSMCYSLIVMVTHGGCCGFLFLIILFCCISIKGWYSVAPPLFIKRVLSSNSLNAGRLVQFACMYGCCICSVYSNRYFKLGFLTIYGSSIKINEFDVWIVFVGLTSITISPFANIQNNTRVILSSMYFLIASEMNMCFVVYNNMCSFTCRVEILVSRLSSCGCSNGSHEICASWILLYCFDQLKVCIIGLGCIVHLLVHFNIW